MSTTNNNIESILEHFNVYLDLKRIPVGIKIIKDKKSFQDSQFKKYERKIPYCTTIRDATQGKSYLLDFDNFSCIASATFLGLCKPLAQFTSGERYVNLGVYENIEVSKKIVDTMSLLKQETIGVEVAPLHAFNENPDVIILITNPYNAMRITQSYAYHNGYTTHNRTLGMCALCHECTSYPLISDEINTSLLCSGTRCVAQWQDDEMAIGIPFTKINDILKGLIITSNLMEPNTKKNEIKQKLEASKLSEKKEIVFSKNYYTNTYLKNK